MHAIAITRKKVSYLIPFLISLLIIIVFLFYIPTIHLFEQNYVNKKIHIIKLDTLHIPKGYSREKAYTRFGMDPQVARELFSNKNSIISMSEGDVYNKVQSDKTMDTINKIPVLKNHNVGRFDLPFAHKLETEYEMMLDKVNAAIGFKKIKGEKLHKELAKFEQLILSYIQGTPMNRNWYTLWIKKKPATRKEKIELIQSLCRLYYYSSEKSTVEQERRFESLKNVFPKIPKEFQQYVKLFEL